MSTATILRTIAVGFILAGAFVGGWLAIDIWRIQAELDREAEMQRLFPGTHSILRKR